MSMERSRLLALIEYVRQSARSRAKVVANVADHGRFLLFDHQAGGMEGLVLDTVADDGEEAVWMSVPRPPNPELPPRGQSAWLAPWLGVGDAVLAAPRLTAAVEGAALIAAGTHGDRRMQSTDIGQAARPSIIPDEIVRLADYPYRAEVERQLVRYLEQEWAPWAEFERGRRRRARLYVQLLTLQQELAGALVDGQLELVWGIGIGAWSHDGASATYPLVTCPVDLVFHPQTGAAEVRPRDVDPRLELDFYASIDCPGVARADRLAREYLASATVPVSPFEPASFEPMLAIARNCLDPDGAPDGPGESRLGIAPSWVLFARPRSASVLIQDLDRYAQLLQPADEEAPLPAAVAAFVTEPAAVAAAPVMPVFRGVSTVSQGPGAGPIAERGDLHFPKPYNDEQLRIVQLLETHDGVVVQGPPGTGKTHTIANIICHWLASGRRVLVSSMKDPALAVLREKLPAEMRPLAIALLASEQEGMQQFESSIRKIASEVQSIDPIAAEQRIAQLVAGMDVLHGRLARIDADLERWAHGNLVRIELESESVDPLDAAEALVRGGSNTDWLPDVFRAGPEFAPRFDDDDLAQLRAARVELGTDIVYVGRRLPPPDGFPDIRVMLQTHADLVRFAQLAQATRSADIPLIADPGQQTLVALHEIAASIDRIRQLRERIDAAGKRWMPDLATRLKAGVFGKECDLLESLGAELTGLNAERQVFLERTVNVPPKAERDGELMQAAENLAAGRRAFGLTGVFFRTEARTKLEQVEVNGEPPLGAAGWQHVVDYLRMLRKARELVARWNGLAAELGLDAVPVDDARAFALVLAEFGGYREVLTLTTEESVLVRETARLFPGWPRARRVAQDPAAMAELEHIIGHYLGTYRLGEVWLVKERLQRALEGASGRAVDDIRRFLDTVLGAPEVGEAAFLSAWSALMAELVRLAAQRDRLETVQAVTERVAASGAPDLAAVLRQPAVSGAPPFPPFDWREGWRRRRLQAHLDAVDSSDEFHRLSALRRDLDHDLAQRYHDLVVQRSWLTLGQRATPRVRAALQAYLNAIQKIGKGTGKRAARYRQDAREAAAEANAAVPCWIMPHHRVSESLPSALGCFDLVIIDEASQSDLSALPVMLRARKLLIVGDDRQVSPEGVGLEEHRVKSVMQRFLGDQVPLYRAQMSPERSIYDLAKVVFAGSGVMLKEHFRCVAPIIEYSKREFYAHELRPLRLPRASERIDPPLVDVWIQNAERKDDLNPAEADYILGEIRRIVADPRLRGRTIGVISLLGDSQALHIWQRLAELFPPDVLQRHAIACGDARTFQGRERDIMFLSMVSAPNNIGAPLSRDMFAQRFNVAASRARDRMVLVRSVDTDDLSEADRLRRGLIAHFARPFAQHTELAGDLRERCESPMERELFDWLTALGFRVTPQARVGAYRIDLLVEGAGDARLAVQCDGDRHQGPESWNEDIRRQRALERTGWVFWRCFATALVLRRPAVLDELAAMLESLGIRPAGTGAAAPDIHVETRNVRVKGVHSAGVGGATPVGSR